MLIELMDFNEAAAKARAEYASQWQDLETVLTTMPVHAKASDQAGKRGRPIFDPVGTNYAIKTALVERSWQPNIPIPAEYGFLGTDVDVGNEGLIAEIQFSNYP